MCPVTNIIPQNYILLSLCFILFILSKIFLDNNLTHSSNARGNTHDRAGEEDLGRALLTGEGHLKEWEKLSS